MSRKELEDFVLAKIVEGIIEKSDYSELKIKCDAQEQLLRTFRIKVNELSKQFRDLEMVHSRVVNDLEARNQNIVTPVKITRAVGLQVCLQKPRDSNISPITPAIAAALNAAKQKSAKLSVERGANASAPVNVQPVNINRKPLRPTSTTTTIIRPKSLENMLQTPQMAPMTPPHAAMQKHQQQLLAKKRQEQQNQQQSLMKQKILQQQKQTQQSMAQKQIISIAQQQVQQRYGRIGANIV